MAPSKRIVARKATTTGLLWLWLLLLIALVMGAARLRFDVEVLNLLPQELPVVQGLKLYQQHFADAQELIITLQGPAEETESAARQLARVLRFQSNLVSSVTWQPAWMEDPAQATELLAYLWLNQPPAALAELTNRLASSHLLQTLAETREQLATSLSPRDIASASYDPYGLTRLPTSVTSAAPGLGTGEDLFVSPDGRFRLLFVQARRELGDYHACQAWLTTIRELVREGQASGLIVPSVDVNYTGRPVFVAEIASGIEKDVGGSAGGTLLVIGVLFWLTHRRLRPLLWLLLLLLLILGVTAAFGGLILGTLSVVSLGFASILAGLAEDFGIVTYQESRSHPELDVPALRRAVAPGIIWSAVTTAGAFLALNLSALPGLRQLGSLVAVGVIVAAFLMLYLYLPALLRLRRAEDRHPSLRSESERWLLFQPIKLLPVPAVWATATLLVLAGSVALFKSGVHVDPSPSALEPRNSQAKATLNRIKTHLGHGEEPWWILVPGETEAAVGRRLTQINTFLSQATSNHHISAFTLPAMLWPQPEYQAANRPALNQIVQTRDQLRQAALGAGFTTNALLLTEQMLTVWEQATANTNLFWPANEASQWLLRKVVARDTNGFFALALVYPSTNTAVAASFAATWPQMFADQGIFLSGWSLLGTTIFQMVMRELPRILLPILLLVLLSLWLAFRSAKEVALSLVTLMVSALFLGAAMILLGWTWNLMNIMALPLMLGIGVDFSIHMQLALQRYRGDRLAVRRSVGRALLLAGTTTVAGFASLSFSSNAGIASLGQVCALGISLAMFTAVYFLPAWWTVVNSKTISSDGSDTQLKQNTL